MERREYSITIQASKDKVWEVLWGEGTYPKWTSAFAEGSDVTTDWQKGSRVIFHDAKGDGMVSEIEDIIPGSLMVFRHLGMIMDGVEDLDSENVKKWAGAIERYDLTENNGNTLVEVSMDIDEANLEYFDKTWPRALGSVKHMAED
ncbi:SRPBCC domain-containing protein [Robertkochia solimangrovi]|uniref:SRPBCC domain-containing protein n=1 Tax=Robertkochia solimangrovi TaxID=2213046 RepID=UPI001180C147|nr:SRPBCC domain-containing protein [Robertkochia solimangrovi]TRZ42307.1 SRPBCC domain-containing protein [Robertkochia solimangrovi]